MDIVKHIQTRDNREYTCGDRNFICLRTRGFPWVIIEELGDFYMSGVKTKELEKVIREVLE